MSEGGLTGCERWCRLQSSAAGGKRLPESFLMTHSTFAHCPNMLTGHLFLMSHRFWSDNLLRSFSSGTVRACVRVCMRARVRGLMDLLM